MKTDSDYRYLQNKPWTDGQLKTVSAIQTIKADKKDKTMYHATFKGLRSEEKQSITLLWRGGQWTLLGARQVEKEVAGLLRLEFLNDLR